MLWALWALPALVIVVAKKKKKEMKKKSRYVKLPANSQVGEGPRIDERHQGRIAFAWSRNTSLDLLSRLNLAIL